MPNSDRSAEQMRDAWDRRAAKDAFHYIASWEQTWDLQKFFESGEADYDLLVRPILEQFGFDPKGRVALEIGCGTGRLTVQFCKQFRLVYAVDISPEMLSRAKELNYSSNVLWLLNNGLDLSAIADNTMDLAFSYIVFQHIPRSRIVFAYLAEMMRVLSPGGLFIFQFNSRERPSMNWRGRTLWSVIDKLHDSRVMPRLSQKLGSGLVQRLGWDWEAAGSSWRGDVIEPSKVMRHLWAHGAGPLKITGWGSNMTWCYGSKERS